MSRKGKYIPQHLRSPAEREKKRAQWRVQYARSQIDAGYGYIPTHDIKKDAGYGLPIGAIPKEEPSPEEIAKIVRETREEVERALQAASSRKISELEPELSREELLAHIDLQTELARQEGSDETEQPQEEEKDAPQS